jgi:uncharacterized membrane protein
MKRLTTQGKLVKLAAVLGVGLLATYVNAKEIQSHASIDIHAPISKVWGLMSSINDWPTWNSAIDSMKFSGKFERKERFMWRSKGFTVTSTLQDIELNRELSWTGEAFGTHAVHRWTFTEHDGVVTVGGVRSFV